MGRVNGGPGVRQRHGGGAGSRRGGAGPGGDDGQLCVERFCQGVERKLKGGLSSVLVLYMISSSRVPIHGYSIIHRMEEVTGGSIIIQAGTVYPILRTLEEMGFVSHVAERSIRGPARKVYSLTPESRAAVQRFDQLIGDFFGAIESVRVNRRALEASDP